MNEIQPIKSIIKPDEISLSVLIEGYDAWLDAQAKSANTRQTYLIRLDKWFDWLGERAWYMVTPRDVVAWREHLAESYSPASIA
jgi:hypothetical protein